MKDSKIVELIGKINEKMESAKLEKVKLENSRDIFQTRANELAKELMEKTKSASVKEAYTKLYNAHEAEIELSKVMSDMADCYDTGDFSNFKELSDKAMELSEKIKNIIPMENSVNSEEKAEDIKTDEDKKEELSNKYNVKTDEVTKDNKNENTEENKKVVDDEDDEDDEIVAPKSKTSSTKSKAKKSTVADDDDDEDI